MEKQNYSCQVVCFHIHNHIYTCVNVNGYCCICAVPLGEEVVLSNKELRLLFNESGHLTSWTNLRTGVTHSMQHDYLQRVEKGSVNEWNVCDGTNVYTFVPDDGVNQLTPKVLNRCMFHSCIQNVSH